MVDRIHLAISPCPNDTYAFSGLLAGAVDREGIEFRTELLDIAELNRRLFAGEFDVAKASFHAALYLTEQTCVLPVGAALGFGVGPLLLGRTGGTPAEGARVLCPGPHTTATLLYRMCYPDGPAPEHRIFSDIMPALAQGTADYGVCIHEGRFTWADSGLQLVDDLGARWEREAGGPLPLGGLLGRRRLGPLLPRVARVIARSLAWADAHRAEALEVMRQHAQEMAEEVIWGHVQLYVNGHTRELGCEGRDALRHMYEVAVQRGLISAGARPLEVC